MTAPVYDVDFYSDAVIADPLPHYRAMQALGPVVWLPAQNAYALVSHKAVTEALRRPAVFQSGRGLSLNDEVNKNLIGSTLNTDGEKHTRKRMITAPPITPIPLEPLEPQIAQAADDLAEALVARGRFDAVADFAQILPLRFVIDLVGLPDVGSAKMLKWASATFNVFEGFNERSKAAFADIAELQAFLAEYGREDQLKEGGLARRIFELADDNGLSVEEAAQQMRDYINPSLDTTISVAGFAAWHFAQSPDQWDKLVADPKLADGAVEELVRLTTPIRAFSRYVAEDAVVEGVPIRKANRVIIVYAAANRDPKLFEDPDRFDITRAARRHMGFGHGKHMCMGMHLARMELRHLLRAMAERVKCWDIAGEPEIAFNNTIRAFKRLPVTVTPL
ncbi:MAG: cytochrome P450 [Pseudomonadota bacterium]